MAGTITLRAIALPAILLSAISLQACVGPSQDVTGLTRLGDAQVAELVAQPVTFRSTVDPTAYRLAAGGRLTATNAGENHAGTWTRRGDRLCVSIPAGATPDCFEVWRAPDAAYVFRAENGTLSERFARIK